MPVSKHIAHPVRTTPPTWALIVAFAIIYTSWGTTYLAIRWAVFDQQLPPALFGGFRLLAAGLIVLAMEVVRGQSLRINWHDAGKLAAMSVFLFLFANYFVSLGQRWVQSGVAAILAATTPLWIGLLGMFWRDGDPLSWRGWLGIAVGLAGVVVLRLPTLLGEAFDPGENLGAFLILGSAFSWAMGTLLVRHSRFHIGHFAIAGYQMLFGGIGQLLVGSALGEWPQLHWPPALPAIQLFLYLLIVGSLTGFLAYNWLLRHVSAQLVGTYAYVNPVVAVLLSILFEEPDLRSLLLGITTILIAVALIRNDHAPKKSADDQIAEEPSCLDPSSSALDLPACSEYERPS